MKKYRVGEQLPQIAHKTKMPNPVFSELKNLKVGESLEVDKNEWKRKTPLGVAVHSCTYQPRGYLLGMKFSAKSLLFNTGWLVTRKEDRYATKKD